MRNFRLTPLIIAIVGIVLTGGVGAALYYFLISPQLQKIAAQQSRYDQNKASLDPLAMKQAQDALVAAKKQAAVITAQWQTVQATKNPNIDLSDRYRSWFQWTSEVNYDFSQRVNSYLKHTGVTSMTDIGAPDTVSDPNAVPSGTLAVSLGNISVFGSYNQILNHVASWNKFSRIVLVDNLALDGYSPFMTGSYDATEYIFTKNSDKPGPPVPSGSAATGAVPPKPMNPADLTSNKANQSQVID